MKKRAIHVRLASNQEEKTNESTDPSLSDEGRTSEGEKS